MCMITCNKRSTQQMDSLKDQIDALIAELQEMRENLTQCACSDDGSAKPVKEPTGESEEPQND